MRVVVVGSGFAGVEAVRALAGYCGERFECIWVTRRAKLVFLPSLPEVAGGRLRPEDVEWSVERLAARTGFQLVEHSVEAVEEGKLLLNNGEQIEYDYVILATGAGPAFFNVPGAEEYTIPLYSVDAAVKLHNAVRSASRLAIVGAGLVGVEVAGEAKHANPELRVTLIDMMDKPLVTLRNERASRLVEEELEKLGIERLYGAKVTRVEEGRVETTRGTVEADVVVWAAGLQASKPEIRIGNVKYAKGGYIVVDAFLRAAPRVYSAGDVACVSRSGCYSLKMVREAMRQGRLAARNIVAEATGGRLREYHPIITDCRPLAGVTLGPGRGVLVIGRSFAVKTRLVELYKDWQRRRYAALLSR